VPCAEELPRAFFLLAAAPQAQNRVSAKTAFAKHWTSAHDRAAGRMATARAGV
jgi:hypothetical protein